MEYIAYKCCVFSTILILNSVMPTISSSNGYCSKDYVCNNALDVNFKNAKHLLCYHNCQPTAQCGRTTILCNSDKFRETILNLHNRLRSEEAQGRSSDPENTIANMKALSYDLDREFLAYCTSSMCTGQPNDEVGCKSPTNGKALLIEHVLNTVKPFSSEINFDDDQLLETVSV